MRIFKRFICIPIVVCLILICSFLTAYAYPNAGNTPPSSVNNPYFTELQFSVVCDETFPSFRAGTKFRNGSYGPYSVTNYGRFNNNTLLNLVYMDAGSEAGVSYEYQRFTTYIVTSPKATYNSGCYLILIPVNQDSFKSRLDNQSGSYALSFYTWTWPTTTTMQWYMTFESVASTWGTFSLATYDSNLDEFGFDGQAGICISYKYGLQHNERQSLFNPSNYPTIKTSDGSMSDYILFSVYDLGTSDLAYPYWLQSAIANINSTNLWGTINGNDFPYTDKFNVFSNTNVKYGDVATDYDGSSSGGSSGGGSGSGGSSGIDYSPTLESILVTLQAQKDILLSMQSDLSSLNDNVAQINEKLSGLMTSSEYKQIVDQQTETIMGDDKTYDPADTSNFDEYNRLENELPSVSGDDLDEAIDVSSYFETYSGGFKFWSEKFEAVFGIHPGLSAVLLFALSIGLGTFIIGRRV